MYTKDEYFIKKSFGKAEHFRVPKGYFDTLNARVLNELKIEPHEPVSVPARTIPLWHRYRAAAVSVAASVLVGCFALGAWMHEGSRTSSKSAQNITYSSASSSGLDAMMNYSMMDTDDMYSYLADSE